MRTAVEAFGEQWREVDVIQISTPDTRRNATGPTSHTETLTFGMACNALIRSLRRVDDADRRHYASGRERYVPLRAGMFTLGDMARAFAEWRAGERWVSGYGAACDAVMGRFFGEVTTEEPAEDWESIADLRALLIEIDRSGSNALALLPLRDGGIAEYRREIRAMLDYVSIALEMLDATP